MRATFHQLFHALARIGLHRSLRATRLLLMLTAMAAVVGSLCAAFLWSLDAATHARFAQPWLLFLLPLGGAAVSLLYRWLGQSVEAGNNLLIDQIHEPGGGIPLRMAPLIFAGTVISHLFGGSAGREGTAVQLGGSVASTAARLARLDAAGLRLMLMAGIAAGFGAVFGTPLAGAIFALEVLAVGRIEMTALIPCLIAALVGDWVCGLWGIHHTAYRIPFMAWPNGAAPLDPLLVGKAALAGVAFGLAGLTFAEANHALGGWLKKVIPHPALRSMLGGVAVIGLTYAVGTRAYLGLGVWSPDPTMPTIAGFFTGPAGSWDWALKLVFTVVTLSSGFKGGEVTPLFFIGAALGNALGVAMGAPVDLFAGLGFVAVFAGAANTPLACTIMGMELFGATHMVPLAVACFVACLCSGHNGIYLSQRIALPKFPSRTLPPGTTLRDVRGHRNRRKA